MKGMEFHMATATALKPSVPKPTARPRQGVSMSALIQPKTITVDGLSVRYAEGGQDGPNAILMSPRGLKAYTPSSRPGRTSRPPRT